VALLREVGLSTDVMPRYPHEFSGGQRQRIAIAGCSGGVMKSGRIVEVGDTMDVMRSTVRPNTQVVLAVSMVMSAAA
jgi:ABC-type oligopeptide transport system ATPase subunit